MTRQEALEILKGDFSNVILKENESHSDAFTMAFKMAIEALEKMTPQKPLWVYNDEPLCPNCGAVLDDCETPCENCHQFLDWSDE